MLEIKCKGLILGYIGEGMKQGKLSHTTVTIGNIITTWEILTVSSYAENNIYQPFSTQVLIQNNC